MPFVNMLIAGRLKATSRVIATRALSATRLAPSHRESRPFFSKNYKNAAVAMRLLPSTNGWFFTNRNNSAAAFSSRLG